MTLQPGAGGWAGVVQALQRKSSAAVWESLFKSSFPSSSPGGHCLVCNAHQNAQAQPGRVGSTQLPSEASTVLRQDSVQGSHGFKPLCVPRESCLVLFPPGFYQQPPLAQNTGDKNHQAPVFAPRITPCPGNNKRSPKGSSRMSKDF